MDITVDDIDKHGRLIFVNNGSAMRWRGLGAQKYQNAQN